MRNGERSFLRFKLLKNAFWSNLTEEHLNGLTFLFIDSKIVKIIDNKDNIEDFLF